MRVNIHIYSGDPCIQVLATHIRPPNLQITFGIGPLDFSGRETVYVEKCAC